MPYGRYTSTIHVKVLYRIGRANKTVAHRVHVLCDQLIHKITTIKPVKMWTNPLCESGENSE